MIILKDEKLKEAVSLDQVQERIGQAIRKRYGDNAWMRRAFPEGYAIYDIDGKMFKVTFSLDEEMSVTLVEDAVEVMLNEQYIPIKESLRLIESKNDEGTEWEVVLIEAGRSDNNFTYPIEALEEAIHLFEGVRAFANSGGEHVEDEREKRVRDIVGWFSGVKRSGNNLVATFHLVESAQWLGKMMLSAWKKDKKDIVGFSIDALGKASMKQAGGSLTYMVESIKHVLSVDVVVNPAAGGRIIKLIASNGGPICPPNSNNLSGEELQMLNKLLKLLEAKRPDLYANIDKDKISEDEVLKLLESAVPGEDVLGELKTLKESAKKKTVTTEEPEDGYAIDAHLKESQKRLDDTVAAFEKKLECSTALRESLSSSGLQDISQLRISEQFKGTVFEQAALDAAISYEKEYLSRFSESGKVAGFGETHSVGVEQREKHEHALDGFFLGREVENVGRFKTLKEAYAVITGKHNEKPSVIFRESYPMQLAGHPMLRKFAESLTSASWGEVLGDAISRSMLAMYRQPGLDAWRKIVSDIVPVSNFKTQHRMRVGGYGLLPTVAESGSYDPLTSPTDEEATYALSKKGGTEKLTEEMIANDDVGATRQIPRKLSRAAARTLYRFAFDFIKDNPTVYDSVALFHASHGNLGSAALSHSELFNRRLAMRDQAEYGASAEVLGLLPALLLVSGENEELAFELSRSDKKIGGNNNEKNFFQNSFESLVVDYWADPDDWALVANPLDIPTVEIGFYEGDEEPKLFVQDMANVGSMFDTDEITYKIKHTYGGAVMDYRGLQKNIVA